MNHSGKVLEGGDSGPARRYRGSMVRRDAIISWILYLDSTGYLDHTRGHLTDLSRSKLCVHADHGIDRFKFKRAHTGANVDIMIKSVDQNGSLRLSLVRFCYIQVHLLAGLPSK